MNSIHSSATVALPSCKERAREPRSYGASPRWCLPPAGVTTRDRRCAAHPTLVWAREAVTHPLSAEDVQSWTCVRGHPWVFHPQVLQADATRAFSGPNCPYRLRERWVGDPTFRPPDR